MHHYRYHHPFLPFCGCLHFPIIIIIIIITIIIIIVSQNSISGSTIPSA